VRVGVTRRTLEACVGGPSTGGTALPRARSRRAVPLTISRAVGIGFRPVILSVAVKSRSAHHLKQRSAGDGRAATVPAFASRSVQGASPGTE